MLAALPGHTQGPGDARHRQMVDHQARQRPAHRRTRELRARIGRLTHILAPHMGALRAPVAAHAHMQDRGAPPAGYVRGAPDHRATRLALAPAASAPPVLTSNTARQHCMVCLNALARHLQPQAIQACERAQIRAIKDSIGHVEVFQMDGVAISIIERPRPLPGHDTPNPAHNTYTLKCEEPVYPFKFTTASKQSRLEREWSTTTACLPVRHKTCFIDSISLRSSTGLSPFKVSSRSPYSPHTNQRIKNCPHIARRPRQNAEASLTFSY